MQLGTVLVALLAIIGTGARAQPLPGIAGTFSQTGEYGDTLDALGAADVQITSLTLFRDVSDRGGAHAPETDWPAIANQVDPCIGMSLTLTVSVFDTVARDGVSAWPRFCGAGY